MTKITLKGHIIVPKADLAEVQTALATHITLTQQEEGCLVFHVKQCSNNPQRFDVYEEFVDQAAFNLHQQRVASSEWGQITQNVSRHYRITAETNNCDTNQDNS